MKVAFAGARTLNISKTVGPLLAEIIKLPPGTIVLLRRPASRSEPIGQFEVFCAQLCEKLEDLYVQWHEPDIEQYEGRAATFERDIRMAQQADKVVAFFPEGLVMAGGTGHLVEKFHDIGKESECFAVRPDGSYYWAGGMIPASV